MAVFLRSQTSIFEITPNWCGKICNKQIENQSDVSIFVKTENNRIVQLEARYPIITSTERVEISAPIRFNLNQSKLTIRSKIYRNEAELQQAKLNRHQLIDETIRKCFANISQQQCNVMHSYLNGRLQRLELEVALPETHADKKEKR